MAPTFRNTSGDRLHIPNLDARLAADQTVDVDEPTARTLRANPALAEVKRTAAPKPNTQQPAKRNTAQPAKPNTIQPVSNTADQKGDQK